MAFVLSSLSMAMPFCHRCLELCAARGHNFGHSGFNFHRDYEHHDVESLASSSQACPLCQILASLLPTPNCGSLSTESNSHTVDYWLKVAPRGRVFIQTEYCDNSALKSSHLLCIKIKTTESDELYPGCPDNPPLFFLAVSHGSYPSLLSAPPVLSVKRSELTLSDRILGVKQWDRNCKKYHGLDCTTTVSDNTLPGRLIECSSDSLRLLDIKEVIRGNERPQYITLSHCWGESTTMYKTTQRTLSEHQSLIPFSALPKTFQDAIFISRELGVQYLWIDSLCIIQDNNEDWECEASKMGSIFHGAYLTISALSSANSNGGCIFPLDIKPFTKLDLPGANRGTVYIQQEPCSRQVIEDIFKNSPMERRGWILQEMILSNRVVHFSEGQIFWQCRKLFQSEDRIHTSVYQEQFSGNFEPIHPLPSLRNLSTASWWALVVEHWSRSLTFPQDSLPSLAGMTTLYQKITADESVLGLWKKRLPVHLSWYMLEPVHPVRSEATDDSYPSWSWTCIKPSHRHPPNGETLPPERAPFTVHIENYGEDDIWMTGIRSIDLDGAGAVSMPILPSARLQVERYTWPLESIREEMAASPSDWEESQFSYFDFGEDQEEEADQGDDTDREEEEREADDDDQEIEDNKGDRDEKEDAMDEECRAGEECNNPDRVTPIELPLWANYGIGLFGDVDLYSMLIIPITSNIGPRGLYRRVGILKRSWFAEYVTPYEMESFVERLRDVLFANGRVLEVVELV